MGSSSNENNIIDEIESDMSSAFEKFKESETDINDFLSQLQETEINQFALTMSLTNELTDESFPEEASDNQFPEDYYFSEELNEIFENLQNSQQSWVENVKSMIKAETGIVSVALDELGDMQKFLLQKLICLEVAKTFVKCSILEEPSSSATFDAEPTESQKPEEEKNDEKDETNNT